MTETQHPSKGKGLRDIGHKMSMVLDTKKPNFWLSMEIVVLYLVPYDTLLQNATDVITKSYSFVTKPDIYYKMQEICY